MEDKYLVVIHQHGRFTVQDLQNNWKGTSGYKVNIADHRVFIWTVTSNSRDKVGHGIRGLYFQDTFFICKLCERYYSYCIVYVYRAQHVDKMAQIDAFTDKIRRELFWKPRPAFNYRKLGRGVSLPFDEKNLNRDPSKDLNKFMDDLLERANFSQAMDIFTFTYGSLQINLFEGYPIPDETEGFNFITTLTSDSFWSIARVFSQPYQPLVWASLGLSILGSIFLLISVKMFGKSQFSGSRLTWLILLNLIEVSLSDGTVFGRKTALKILRAVGWS